MSRFSSLLKEPLPSQRGSLYSEAAMLDDEEMNDDEMIDEGVEDPDDFDGMDTDEDYDDDDDVANEGCENECGMAGCSESDDDDDDDEDDIEIDDDDDDDDDLSLDIEDDIDDLSDEDLALLDKELGGDEVDGEVNLDPREEMEADDMMSVAATSMLVNDELNAEEKVQFLESEAQLAVEEGFLTDADVAEMMEESGLMTEAKYNQKMIIRLDAASKKKQLYALAVNICAAAKHDPDYVKYKKLMRVKKILRAKLDRKYHSEATKRMKIYFARLRRSKSTTLNKIAGR